MVLGLAALNEEIVWRRVLLGELLFEARSAALAASALGFAISHRARPGLHLGTGAAFGAVYLATGALTASVAAHWAYNVLVGARACDPARDSGRLRERRRAHRCDEALRAQGRSRRRFVLGRGGPGRCVARAERSRESRQPWQSCSGCAGPIPGRRSSSASTRESRGPGAPCGVAPQEIAFPATLRVHELLELVRRHYANPSSSAALCRPLPVSGKPGRASSGPSGGERRRVAVALAFAGDPRLVVLDEPTAGLDQESRHAVWDAVRAHVGAGGAILLTTHQPGEADALAGRVVAIEAGSVVADDTAAGARAASGLVLVRFRAPPERTFPGAEREGCFLCLRAADGGAEVARLVRAGVALDDLEVRPLTLEEALAARREAEE